MSRTLVALAAAVATAAFVPAAFAGSGLRVGAVEDAAKWGSAQAKMDLAKLSGFDSVRMTMQWSAGQTAPDPAVLSNTQAAVQAAVADGIDPVVAIYNTGSSATPADDASRAQFVQFATAVATALPAVQKFIVGNEPNSNLYWLPQFNADGSDAAAQAYEALLAAAYDALEQARPDALVLGGALDPRGNDNPSGTKLTHSPTTFIKDLGAAYRASGRRAPIMDAFDQHVYADTSALPPSMEHPNSTTVAEADYGKLVSLLGQAFDGTAQQGSTLPILYGEFGVETIIPTAKAPLYTGSEPSSTGAVDEATQARYYTEAFKLASCQPNVIGIMVFHVSDESALSGWQSGPNYVDDTPKSSFGAIRDAASSARAGTLTTCPDATPPTATLTAPADGTLVGAAGVTFAGTATDNVGVGRVDFLANGAVVGTKFAAPYSFTWRPTASGSYTLAVRAQDAVRNVGTSSSVTVTVDVTAPETTLTSAAPPEFDFSASEPATFACSIDGAAFTACTSPALYPGLAPGAHTFQVRATDLAGNVDASPAAYTWTVVDTTPPETTITSAPSGTTTSHDASIAFTATEAATFECSLDSGPWAACASPASYALADGTHVFQVRATDTAGNVDPSPASATWTVVSAPPNDAFAAAQPLATTWSGSVSGTNRYATKEPGEPDHDGNVGGHSVWYTWRAPGNGWVTLSTSGSSFTTAIGVYTGSSVSALTRAGAGTSSVRFKARNGAVYRIAVDGWNGASGTFALAWRAG